MRYFGSKSSTANRVCDIVSKRIPAGSICDPFGGIGVMGAHFKSRNYSVWSGDILTCAHYFQIARIQRNRVPIFRRLREELNLTSTTDLVHLLNTMKRRKGWFVREYAERRHFFTKENAGRIESCRLAINRWIRNGWLSNSEQAVLTASLVNSIDRVANTAGTYYAYLKKWYRKALLPFRFDLIPPTVGNSDSQCFLSEAKHLVARRPFDVLYLDPPYNQRSYAHYYHLPETLATGKAPYVHGNSGISSSVKAQSCFNTPKLARKALEELLENAQFRLLVFHYSDDGIIKPNDLRRMFASLGATEEVLLESKGYTTIANSRNIKHRLYLVEKNE